MLKRKLVLLFACLLIVSGLAVRANAVEVQSYKINDNTFELVYKPDTKITYNKMLLDKPTRFVVDLIGVDKCDFCNKPMMVLSSGESSKIKVGYHDSKKDFLYKLYGKPTLRVVFEFESRKKIPEFTVNDSSGRFIIRVKPLSKNETILERVSFRKFKDYEMVVALLNRKPTYQVMDEDGSVYLTIKGAVAEKSALVAQNVGDVSNTVSTIRPEKIGKEIVRYDIKLKNGAKLTRYYADKRHIYLIFRSQGNAKQLVKSPNSSTSSTVLAANEKASPGKKRAKKKKVYTGKRISFNVRNADIKDIFRVFAKISGLNFITSDDVKGTLTMELHDVPWDQAFDLILQQKGLVAEREGNIIRITTAAKLQQEKKLQLEALKEKEALERAKNAITEVIKLNYISPDYAIKIINHLLYNQTGTGKNAQVGFIVADVKNNAIICHDIKQNIAKIRKIIDAIDKRKKAVEIDARIVEINKSFERQLGIQWGGSFANYYNAAASTHTFIGVGGGTAPSNPFNPDLPQENFIVNLPTSLSDAPVAGALSLLVGKSDYNIDLKLTAGEIEGYSKILSSPRVITLDNEPAKIESGKQIPYQQTAGASGATTVSFKSATLALEVTPHITNNNKIILKIKVSKDSADFAHAVNGEPPINTNSVQTTVVLNNGQTVVLGGLIQKTNLKTTSGVPGLMRIPLLGWLFKTKRYYNPENELFVFVTPKIVEK